MSPRRLVLSALFVFVLGYALFALAHMVPPAPYGLADDWRVFYAAAHVVQAGGNPYDTATIHGAEQAAQHYANVQPSLDDFTDVPVVALFLRAFAWLPYWSSFAVFTILGLCAAAAALAAWMRSAGWRSGMWLLAALCSWPMLLGLFAGQFDALLLAGAVASCLALRRGHATVAGACMAVVLLKPHLLWPFPLLLAATLSGEREQLVRFVTAAGSVIAAGLAAGFLLVPGSASFFPHLLGFGGRLGVVQPDLAGLPGLLARLPGGAVLGLGIAAAGAAIVLVGVVVTWRLARGHALSVRRAQLIPFAGLAVWLAAAPYAHPNDDVLLFPLVALLVGQHARLLDPRWLVAGIAGSVALATAFIAGATAGYAMLLVFAAAGVIEHRRLTDRALAALAVSALALLPAVWPLHLVPVSLTPVAVTLVALAGVARVLERRTLAVRKISRVAAAA